MSFPRYGKYKPSGLTLLGDVPTHWSRTALKYMGEYQNGYPFKPEDRSGQGLPIIRISQLSGDSEPNLYDGELDDRVLVRDGDLLFSWSATIDSFIWHGGLAWLNQHIFKVTPSGEAHKGFLFYVIKHIAPKLAEFDAHGSTMRHIKKESLGERIFVPSVEEQAQVAAFLDRETGKIDALVEEQNRLIELLREKRQAVISHAVTKGLNPDAPMKTSGVEWLGEVPAHWDVRSLRTLASVVRGASPRPAGDPAFFNGDFIPWVTVAEITKDNLFELTGTDSYLTEEGANSSRIFRSGTVVYSNSGATLGVPKILRVNACANDGVVGFESLSDCLNPLFLYHYLHSLTSTIREMVKQGSGQPNLNTSIVKAIPIALPPLDEQAGICRHIDQIAQRFDVLTVEAEAAVELLQERRTALISAAVTGKIDVREFSHAKAA